MPKDLYILLFLFYNIDLLFVYFWHFDRTFWIAYCKPQNYCKQRLTVAWTIQLESKSIHNPLTNHLSGIYYSSFTSATYPLRGFDCVFSHLCFNQYLIIIYSQFTHMNVVPSERVKQSRGICFCILGLECICAKERKKERERECKCGLCFGRERLSPER